MSIPFQFCRKDLKHSKHLIEFRECLLNLQKYRHIKIELKQKEVAGRKLYLLSKLSKAMTCFLDKSGLRGYCRQWKRNERAGQQLWLSWSQVLLRVVYGAPLDLPPASAITTRFGLKGCGKSSRKSVMSIIKFVCTWEDIRPQGHWLCLVIPSGSKLRRGECAASRWS